MKEIEKIVKGEINALVKAKTILSKRALHYAMEKTTNDSTRNKFYQIYKDLTGYKIKLPEEAKHKKVITEEKLTGKLERKVVGKKYKKLLQLSKQCEKAKTDDKGIPESLSKLIKEEENKDLGKLTEEKIPDDDDEEIEQVQEEDQGKANKKKREDVVMEFTEQPELKKKKKKIKVKPSKTETKKKVTFALGQNTTKGKNKPIHD